MIVLQNGDLVFGVEKGQAETDWPRSRADWILYAKLSLIPADDLELRSTAKAGLAALVPLKALAVFGVLGVGLLFGITSVPRSMPQRFDSSMTSAAPMQEKFTIPADLIDRKAIGTRITRTSAFDESLATRPGPTAPPAVPSAPAGLRIE